VQFEVVSELLEQSLVCKIIAEDRYETLVCFDVLVFGEVCAMEEKEVEIYVLMLDVEDIEQFDKVHLDFRTVRAPNDVERTYCFYGELFVELNLKL
jgi:hypothetical protein